MWKLIYEKDERIQKKEEGIKQYEEEKLSRVFVGKRKNKAPTGPRKKLKVRFLKRVSDQISYVRKLIFTQSETSKEVTESGDKTIQEEAESKDELISELEVQVIKICFVVIIVAMKQKFLFILVT